VYKNDAGIKCLLLIYPNNFSVKKLAKAVFTHSMDDFLTLMPNREEFSLLLALLFYNPGG
jgi:hypothetical protein